MQTIDDVMTRDPLTADLTTPIVRVAEMMREGDVGDVIVLEEGRIYGIVTDRDIVVRAVADGRSPEEVPVGDITSRDLSCVAPYESVDEAVRLMREKAIRRLPVLDDGRPVGIVSIGDLAVNRDPDSALGQISSAPPNT